MTTITSDVDLRDRILSSLRAQSVFDTSGITVEVHEGKVLLGGVAASPEARTAAEWAVRGVRGVAQLDTEISIDLTPPRVIS